MSTESQADLRFGAYRIDRGQRLLFSGSELVPLAPKTFELLLALVEAHGRIVEKDALLNRVWPDTFVEEGSLTRNVSILRKVLGKGADDQTYIATVPKRGYRFVAPVTVSSPTADQLEAPAHPIVPPPVLTDGHRKPWKATVALLAAVVVLGGLAGWVYFDRTRGTPPVDVLRLGFTLPESEPFHVFTGSPISAVALSSDGQFVVYVTLSATTNRLHLYHRQLNRFDAQQVPDSEGGFNPFIAPDGRSIGFFTEDSLRTIALAGGRAETLAQLRDAYGGAEWEDDGTIIFDAGRGLARVLSSGGPPTRLTTLDEARGEVHHLWPRLLPGGKDLLFTVQSASPRGVEVRIDAVSLATGNRRTVLNNAAFAHYLPIGRLIYSVDGAIFGVPFDAAKLAVTGPPVKLLDDVAATRDAAHLSISRDGTLAYVRGRPVELTRSLVVVDRTGIPTTLPAPPRSYQMPKLSPDGLSVLLFTWESARSDVWTYDLVRNGLTRLTSSGTTSLPVWSPDGRSIMYGDMFDAAYNVVVQPADGRTAARKIAPTSQDQWPLAFSRDGRSVLFTQADPGPRNGTLWTARLDGSEPPRPLLPQQTYEQWGGWPSPDGRWLAYVSDETGQFEVYVTDLPGVTRKWRISSNVGQEPVWSKDGLELFYREGKRMMSVAVGASPASPPGKPTLLFEGDYVACCPGLPQYDTMPDGRGFLMLRENADQSVFTELRVVKGWASELPR